MKKLILFTLMLTVVASAKANMAKITTEVPVKNSTDDVKRKISLVRHELVQIGYSTEMMNNLFGDENFYFPSSRERLNTTFYIVDLLIDNGQYEETDKTTLISLAKKAYNAYKRNEMAETLTN